MKTTEVAGSVREGAVRVEEEDLQGVLPDDNASTTRRESDNPFIIPDRWRGETQGRQRFRVWGVNGGLGVLLTM